MFSKTSLVPVAILVLSAAPLAAQTKFYNTDNVPTTGTCNVIPFGSTARSATWSNQKYQTIMDSSLFKNKTGLICSLGFTPCATGVRSFDTIEIKMDYFQGTGNQLTTTFSNNISSKATTVLSAKDYVWNHTGNTWSHVGLQKPFLYVPKLGHLVVQITVTGARSVTSSGGFHRGGSANLAPVQRMYATGSRWSGNTPPATGTFAATSGLKMEVGFDAWAIDSYGAGCSGSNSQTPSLTLGGSAEIGKILDVNLTGALPSANMFLVIGLSSNGTPIDMASMGARGCRIYTAVDVVLGTKATAAGGFAQKFPIPNNGALVCQQVYMQFFPHDAKINFFGASSSNYVRALIGR